MLSSLRSVCKSDMAQQTLRASQRLIDGKELAQKHLDGLKTEITSWVQKGNRPPHLSVILLEGDPASETYVRMKCKAAEIVGINTEISRVSKTLSEVELLDLIASINQNPDTDGILVQLPLGPNIELRKVCNAISPKKDVDGFTPSSLGNLCLNEPTFVSATALAVHHIISSLGVPTKGKNAVICGRSKHISLPLALILHSSTKLGNTEGLNMTTTICHRHTPEQDLIRYAKTADVLVTAVGIPHLIKSDMVKPGAIVIDVGYTEYFEGEKRCVVGDVDTEEVQKIAKVVSPVPGGVGPMTVAMVMSNTFLAATLRSVDKKEECKAQ